jgi:hypothetical protein
LVNLALADLLLLMHPQIRKTHVMPFPAILEASLAQVALTSARQATANFEHLL